MMQVYMADPYPINFLTVLNIFFFAFLLRFMYLVLEDESSTLVRKQDRSPGGAQGAQGGAAPLVTSIGAFGGRKPL